MSIAFIGFDLIAAIVAVFLIVLSYQNKSLPWMAVGGLLLAWDLWALSRDMGLF